MNKEGLIEIQFRLHPNSTTTVAAQNSASDNNAGHLPRVTQVMALAIQLQHMIDEGEAKDYADLARLSCLCRERVSQIVRLNYLAPDIQIELLYLPPSPGRRYPISEAAVRRIANLLSWAEQRREWARLKTFHRLG
jgi:hypothetical protein